MPDREHDFQSPFNDVADFQGHIDMVTITEDGLAPSTIIRYDGKFKVVVKFHFHGTVLSYWDGTLHTKLYCEGLGNDFEKLLTEKDIDIVADRSEYKVETDWVFPENQFSAEGVPMKEGVYRLTAAVTYTNTNNKPQELAGFRQGPMIQILEC